MKKQKMSHTLVNGKTVEAEVYYLSQLCAKFQIWARQYDLTDEESLACFTVNLPERQDVIDEKLEELAKSGFAKLKEIQIPTL